MSAVEETVASAIAAAPDSDIPPDGIVPYDFDWKNPEYISVFHQRAKQLLWIRKNPAMVPGLRSFYATHPIQFIVDWGVTFDPRNLARGLPSIFPFVPFPRQIDMLHFVLKMWRGSLRGLIEKSRGSGASWLAIALSCTQCLFTPSMTIGFGSRKQDYVDSVGDPKSLFWKARKFMEYLPFELRGGWNEKKHAPQLRIIFPETGSAMTGESGDGIGRGDRTALYYVDEAAFLERAELTEASLSDTTNCRIDISTSGGRNNVFFDRREQLMPLGQVFSFGWVHDPRRTIEWYEKKLTENAEVIIKREYGDRAGNICYDEGGEFFQEAKLLENGEPVEDPIYIDGVYAVIDTAVKTGKEHDGLAVSYFGVCRTQAAKYPLYILDWDLLQVQGAMLKDWIPTVYRYIEELVVLTKARLGSVGVWIEDKASGSVLIQQLQNADQQCHAIDSKLTAMGKSERALDISGYVYQDKVKITRRAYQRVVKFKGVTKNHWLDQVLSFVPGAEDANDHPDDCLDTFTYGCAIGLGNQEGF